MAEQQARARLSDGPALIATWFGAGFVRRAPGSLAALTALPGAALLVWLGGPALLLGAALALFALGIWASDAYMAAVKVHDPPAIVIDEVVGQWITLALLPLDPLVYALGFLLFRVLDILKPWPANFIDRAVTGGFGVMLDDVVAAVYAGGALWLIVRW
ncbi:MAG TPA: phosphatidylglycerophosphatase A, partial [Geminicoccaceae bacterium]|nr:phosphatidylglycerophosphatase A [Geminicoccaceae bacterium]